MTLPFRKPWKAWKGPKGCRAWGRRLINKRLSVNNVSGFDAKNISVEKNGEFVVISVDYEVRNNLFGNVDSIVHFQHEYELKGQ